MPMKEPKSSVTGTKFWFCAIRKRSSSDAFTLTALLRSALSMSLTYSRSCAWLSHADSSVSFHKKSPSVTVPLYLPSLSITGMAV